MVFKEESFFLLYPWIPISKRWNLLKLLSIGFTTEISTYSYSRTIFFIGCFEINIKKINKITYKLFGGLKYSWVSGLKIFEF